MKRSRCSVYLCRLPIGNSSFNSHQIKEQVHFSIINYHKFASFLFPLFSFMLREMMKRRSSMWCSSGIYPSLLLKPKSMAPLIFLCCDSSEFGDVVTIDRRWKLFCVVGWRERRCRRAHREDEVRVNVLDGDDEVLPRTSRFSTRKCSFNRWNWFQSREKKFFHWCRRRRQLFHWCLRWTIDRLSAVQLELLRIKSTIEPISEKIQPNKNHKSSSKIKIVGKMATNVRRYLFREKS